MSGGSLKIRGRRAGMPGNPLPAESKARAVIAALYQAPPWHTRAAGFALGARQF